MASIGDAIKNVVLTEYKADTKQMRRELQKLDGEERRLHQKKIDRIEAENEKIEKANQARLDGLAKGAVAVTALGVAYDKLSEAADFYAKRSRLQAKSVGVDMAGLKKAAKGLLTEQRLLEFAVRATTGTFKLSQEQMEDSIRGAIALRNSGYDLSDTFQAMEESVVEGSVEPLKKFGRVVKDVENDTKEGLNAAIQELRQTAREAGPDLTMPGDALIESQNKMRDATDDLKSAFGEMAQSLTPVIASLAEVVHFLARAAELLMGLRSGSHNPFKPGELERMRAEAVKGHPWLDSEGERLDFKETFNRGPQGRRSANEEFRFGLSNDGHHYPIGDDQIFPHISDPDAARGARHFRDQGKGRGRGLPDPTIRSSDLQVDNIDRKIRAGIDDSFASLRKKFQGQSDEEKEGFRLAEQDAAEFEHSEWVLEQTDELARKQQEMAQQDSILTSLFGGPQELDTAILQLQLLSDTFGMLEDAVASSVDAFITGNMSMAEAFKQSIGESLRAMAKDMAVRALRETALGTAMLFINPAKAGNHFIAAGMFGLGATAAAYGARELGAGQASSTPRPGAGAGAAGVGASGGAAGDSGSTQIFIVGNDFAGLSARQRESQWRQISRSAGVTVEGDAVIDG